jgi:hypothetical protein
MNKEVSSTMPNAAHAAEATPEHSLTVLVQKRSAQNRSQRGGK